MSEKFSGRSHPHHRERGPAKFTYTYADIAKLAGMKVASVHNARSNGELDPTDLGSVVRFLARRLDGQVPEVKAEVQEEDCTCPGKPLGAYSSGQKCFFCLECGLVTRRI